MAKECFELLDRNNVERATKTIKVDEDNIDYLFLDQIITPIYNIVAAVSFLVCCVPKFWKFYLIALG